MSLFQRWEAEAEDKQLFVCLLLFFFPFSCSWYLCLSFLSACVLIRLDSCHKLNPFMINEVAIAVISPTASMWAENSQRKKNTIQNPHSELRLLLQTIGLFRLFFLFQPRVRKRGQTCRVFSVFFMSQNCVAALLHFMGKSVSHHCVLIGCQILAELCVNVCAGNRRCLLQRAVQAERKGYDRLRASTVEAGSCLNCLATVWTRFIPFFLRWWCAAILGF